MHDRWGNCLADPVGATLTPANDEAAKPRLHDKAIGRLATSPDAATALAGTTIGRELFKSTRGVRL